MNKKANVRNLSHTSLAYILCSTKSVPWAEKLTAALFGFLEDRVDWFAKNVLYFSLPVGKRKLCLSSRGNTGTLAPVENVSSAGGGCESCSETAGLPHL